MHVKLVMTALMQAIRSDRSCNRSSPDASHEVDEQGYDVAQLTKVGEPYWNGFMNDGYDDLWR